MFLHQPQLIRNLVKAEEAAVVWTPRTILATASIIAQTSVFNVVAGDRVLLGYFCRMLKGGVAGDTTIEVIKAVGTATLLSKGLTLSAKPLRSMFLSQPAASTWETWNESLYLVTVAGTITAKLQGYSAGSNGTVAINEGSVELVVFR